MTKFVPAIGQMEKCYWQMSKHPCLNIHCQYVLYFSGLLYDECPVALLVFEIWVIFFFLFTVLVDHCEVNYFDLWNAWISHQIHENPSLCLICAETTSDSLFVQIKQNKFMKWEKKKNKKKKKSWLFHRQVICMSAVTQNVSCIAKVQSRPCYSQFGVPARPLIWIPVLLLVF